MQTDVRQHLVGLVLVVPGGQDRAGELGRWLREVLPDDLIALPQNQADDAWSVKLTTPPELWLQFVVDQSDYHEACEVALAAVRRAMADAPVRARSVMVAPRRIEPTRGNIARVTLAYEQGERGKFGTEERHRGAMDAAHAELDRIAAET
jgi:hypothetical protein